MKEQKKWIYFQLGIPYKIVLNIDSDNQDDLKGLKDKENPRTFVFWSGEKFSREIIEQEVSRILNPIF